MNTEFDKYGPELQTGLPCRRVTNHVACADKHGPPIRVVSERGEGLSKICTGTGCQTATVANTEESVKFCERAYQAAVTQELSSEVGVDEVQQGFEETLTSSTKQGFGLRFLIVFLAALFWGAIQSKVISLGEQTTISPFLTSTCVTLNGSNGEWTGLDDMPGEEKKDKPKKPRKPRTAESKTARRTNRRKQLSEQLAYLKALPEAEK